MQNVVIRLALMDKMGNSEVAVQEHMYASMNYLPFIKIQTPSNVSINVFYRACNCNSEPNK